MARSKYEYVSLGNHIFYTLLEAYSRFALRFFFRRLTYNGKQNVSKTKPVLFLVNHQSAFIDPLLVGNFTYRRPWFITRAGVFNSPVTRYIFNSFHMLPIFRLRDKVDITKANEETFRKSREVLKNNGAMLIFPEGSHGMRKRLRAPLRKGFARIALGAEEESNFKLGIDIIPVGIFYEHPTHFRSDAFVNFGTPLNTSDYVELYKEKPSEAFKKLTEDAAVKMSEVLIDLKSVEEYDELEKTWQEARLKENNLFTRFEADKRLVDRILRKEKVKPNVKKESILGKIGLLLFGFPFFVYGFINNAFAFFLTRWFLKSKIKDPHFNHSIMYAFGMFVLPIIVLLQAIALQLVFHNYFYSLLYLLTTPFLGVIAFDYYDTLIRKQNPPATTELMKDFGSL